MQMERHGGTALMGLADCVPVDASGVGQEAEVERRWIGVTTDRDAGPAGLAKWPTSQAVPNWLIRQCIPLRQ